MILSQTEYAEYFHGYHIIDCVVRDRNTLYWTLLSTYDDSKPAPPTHERATSIVSCFLDEPEDAWGWTRMTGMSLMKAGASLEPDSRFVGVDLAGHVYVIGGGENRLEKDVPNGKLEASRGAITRLKTLFGRLYACGGLRSLCHRDGAESWLAVGGNPPLPSRKEVDNRVCGFNDFDAFSIDDIYCAGDRGNVWHWNGKTWRRVDFPSNMYLESVCCGSDGYVYIGAQSGNVWRGRDDRWELFHEDSLSLPFMDMVWFADTLWATSDYGLWQLRAGKIVKADVPIAISNSSGNLSVNDGVMLLSGDYGAALHDGNEWMLLFDLATLRSEHAKKPA
ncbi:WD40/YVTN/BNR-like repeat-containing protein [Dokdonella koreensis]|uniref:WD40/YVTN/BNR-like repeat-containing protein n=1 Tax=Dokdonella koreensis TaxID=323415 RepID=UPI001CBC3E4C|nr:hypothetical protein [Dokdonella koreensis]